MDRLLDRSFHVALILLMVVESVVLVKMFFPDFVSRFVSGSVVDSDNGQFDHTSQFGVIDGQLPFATQGADFQGCDHGLIDQFDDTDGLSD